MMSLIEKFCTDEDGAVTVDFVVLAAAIVIIGLIVGSMVREGAVDLAEQHEESLKDQARLLDDRASGISF